MTSKLKPTIRRSTFETNSSSMHTLVITKEEVENDASNLIQDINDYMGINCMDGTPFYLEVPSDNEYGRGYQLLSSSLDKIFYLLAYYIGGDLDPVIEAIQKHIPSFIGFQKSIGDWTNSKKYFIDYHGQIVYDSWDIERLFGEVDHQSTEILDMAIKGYIEKYAPEKSFNEVIEDIIFNPKFIIVEDSDESCNLENYLSRGVLNKDAFKFIFHERWDSETGKSYPSFETVDEYLKRFSSDEDDF